MSQGQHGPSSDDSRRPTTNRKRFCIIWNACNLNLQPALIMSAGSALSVSASKETPTRRGSTTKSDLSVNNAIPQNMMKLYNRAPHILTILGAITYLFLREKLTLFFLQWTGYVGDSPLADKQAYVSAAIYTEIACFTLVVSGIFLYIVGLCVNRVKKRKVEQGT